MRDLDYTKAYYLGNLKKAESKLIELNTYLHKTDKICKLLVWSDILRYDFLYYNMLDRQWEFTNVVLDSVCALTLFEEDRYPYLFFNQIEELKKTVSKLGLTIDVIIKNK